MIIVQKNPIFNINEVINGGNMKVLIACEFTGTVRRAFRNRGHDAWSCDILDAEDGSPYHIKDDVLKHLDEGWDMMIAHPPCTDLAVSGARWFKEKIADGRQQNSIDFFMALANANIPKIAVENPICIMSSKWRKPDQIIQPYEYGHGETKSTCLWLKNLPKLKPTKVVDGRENRIHKGCGYGWNTEECKRERSRTFPGIADAMAEQWGKISY